MLLHIRITALRIRPVTECLVLPGVTRTKAPGKLRPREISSKFASRTRALTPGGPMSAPRMQSRRAAHRARPSPFVPRPRRPPNEPGPSARRPAGGFAGTAVLRPALPAALLLFLAVMLRSGAMDGLMNFLDFGAGVLALVSLSRHRAVGPGRHRPDGAEVRPPAARPGRAPRHRRRRPRLPRPAHLGQGHRGPHRCGGRRGALHRRRPPRPHRPGHPRRLRVHRRRGDRRGARRLHRHHRLPVVAGAAHERVRRLGAGPGARPQGGPSRGRLCPRRLCHLPRRGGRTTRAADARLTQETGELP